MYYLIQENVFREQHYEMLEKTIAKLGLDYTTIRIFPFVDKIAKLDDIPDGPYVLDDIPEFKTDRNDIFIFGTVKLARISKRNKWTPGSLLNENHDFEVYKNFYKDNLLNYDSKIIDVNDKIDWNGRDLFLRPTADSKLFNGKIYTQDSWDKLRSENDFKDQKIQISSVKRIQKEIRFWVVGGKVITGSQYRLGGQVCYDKLYDDDAIIFAQKMVDKFQISDAFVIDVCLCDNEWKIVECGCINSAGFYLCDIQKLITSLEDYFG